MAAPITILPAFAAMRASLTSASTAIETLSASMAAWRASGATQNQLAIATTGNLAVAFGAGIGRLVPAMEQLFNEFLNFEKQANSLGTTFKGVSQDQQQSIGNLTGAIADKFAIGLELSRQGLYGNNQELAKLSSYQKAVGIESARTVETLKQNMLSGGLTTQAMNNLAKNTLDVGKTYQVSTEALIKTVEALKPTAENLALISGSSSEAVVAGIQAMQGKLGGDEKTGQLLSQVANLLTSTDQTQMAQVASLGLADLRQQLVQAKTPEKVEAILLEAVQRSGNVLDTFKGSIAEGAAATQQAFGAQTVSTFVQLRTAIDTSTQSLRKLDEAPNPFKRFDKIIEPLFDPLKKSFFGLIDKLLPVITPIFELLGRFIAAFADYFTPIVEVISGVFAAFTSLIGGIFGFIESIGGFQVLFTILLPPIFIAVSMAFFGLILSVLPLIISFFSLSIAVLAASWPILLVAAALYGLYKIVEDDLGPVFAFLKEAMVKLKDGLLVVIEPIKNIFMGLKDALLGTLEGFKSLYEGIKNFFGSIFDSIGALFSGDAVGFFSSLLDAVIVIFTDMVPAIVDIFTPLVSFLGNLFVALLQFVTFFATGVVLAGVKLLVDAFFLIPKLIISALVGILDLLPDFMKPEGLIGIGNAAINGMNSISDTIGGLRNDAFAYSVEGFDNLGGKQDDANENLEKIAENTRQPISLPDYLGDLNAELQSAFDTMLGVNDQTLMLQAIGNLGTTMQTVGDKIDGQTNVIGQGIDINKQVVSNTTPRSKPVGNGGN